MAKGVNGTIDPLFQQVVNQRSVIEKRNQQNSPSNSKLGVGSNDRISTLFPKSPLITANRFPDSDEDSRDPDGIQVESGDIYEMFANVIDPSNDSGISSGFGFSGQPHISDPEGDVAYMNYRHPNNPFVVDDETDYNSLTSGEAYSGKKAYKGFPDLDVSNTNLSEPALNQDTDPTSDITIDRREPNFGNTTSQYRAAIAQIQPENLGRHASADENGDINTLGTYFRSNMLEEE